VSRFEENRRNVPQSQGRYSVALDRALDDPLLNAQEILDAWEISDNKLRRLVKLGKLRRVRRPNYQPYYPLSAVVEALGQPVNDPTPRYPMRFESDVAA